MNVHSQLIVVFCIIAGLAGCASVPMATPQLDTAAKQFAPLPDKAVVYIYRHENLGAAIKMDVGVDGHAVGQTAAKTYIRLELVPGRHVVDSQSGKATLELNTEAGAVYYVWQEVKMGFWSGGSALHLVDAAQGQSEVSECGLIQGGM